MARASNGYLDVKQPWKQRKQDLAACGVTINVCLQTVRALATLMAPFLPFSARKCAAMLNLDPSLPWAGAKPFSHYTRLGDGLDTRAHPQLIGRIDSVGEGGLLAQGYVHGDGQQTRRAGHSLVRHLGPLCMLRTPLRLALPPEYVPS